MSVYRPPRINSSEITPRQIYVQAPRVPGRARHLAPWRSTAQARQALRHLRRREQISRSTKKQRHSRTSTTYNNFGEFGLDKGDPPHFSGDFEPLPWTIKVDGMVSKPATFDIEALMKEFPIESRTYRMRCVEAWSMVILWGGFPLAALLNKVEPLGSAKYVAFETVVRPEEMPGQKGIFQSLEWPYVEGLRLDEANTTR